MVTCLNASHEFGYTPKFQSYLKNNSIDVILNYKLLVIEWINLGTEYKFDESGGDSFFMLTVGLRLTRIFGLSLSCKYFDFDYGRQSPLL